MINSDENILQVLEQSNEYLELHPEISSQIKEILDIFRSLEDLIPQTLENIMSGHMFPLVEANTELENSIALCKFGFYKHAFMALRSVLELGLLSVYWDIDGNSHINIQKWLRSIEDTPFKKDIFTKLKTNEYFLKFDDKHKIFENISMLSKQLSNFVHTKGHHYSSMDLGNANSNRFNEKSLCKWLESVMAVSKSVVILHILKYPVAFQHTPVEQKFGINGPVGLFLEPIYAEKIKRFLDKDVVNTLQEISNNDPEAKSLAQWVNDQPDITDEALHAQIEEFEKTHGRHMDESHPETK